VRWVFDFCNTCWFWVFENIQNQRIVGFIYLKISESKNYRVWVFEKNQIQRTTGCTYFKIFKKIIRFHEKTDKDLMIFSKILRTVIVHNN
jgi:hypothetical protein